MCIDIVVICFGIANGQISLMFDRVIFRDTSVFSFQDNKLRENISGFSPNFICAFILWRSGVGLLMGRFRQFVTELSAHQA